MFYERECQEKTLLPTWRPECSLTASPAVLELSRAMGRRRSLSIEPMRATLHARFRDSLPTNVASMATIVLFVTRSLWQFQVVRGGLTCQQRLKGPNRFSDSLPRPVIRMA